MKYKTLKRDEKFYPGDEYLLGDKWVTISGCGHDRGTLVSNYSYIFRRKVKKLRVG